MFCRILFPKVIFKVPLSLYKILHRWKYAHPLTFWVLQKIFFVFKFEQSAIILDPDWFLLNVPVRWQGSNLISAVIPNLFFTISSTFFSQMLQVSFGVSSTPSIRKLFGRYLSSSSINLSDPKDRPIYSLYLLEFYQRHFLVWIILHQVFLA